MDGVRRKCHDNTAASFPFFEVKGAKPMLQLTKILNAYTEFVYTATYFLYCNTPFSYYHIQNPDGNTELADTGTKIVDCNTAFAHAKPRVPDYHTAFPYSYPQFLYGNTETPYGYPQFLNALFNCFPRAESLEEDYC